ncbi:SusC/RagA family TonB-linked outer membrane protein [Pontibacter sp. E15-1]|uniref:SusC/RagA family TonB-linked outer membrane protein n=1 Tax=Pontibacter sp. E15-1 TaxID=2919918 RepID=UPI001F500D17|nr:SusC/RagA family TonB-linked outer membrane protein [Pontibacter sp. E15-1]MCJ8165932.1 SusC/RagA family TonB-linked outer membrane protein [Pontibacter sp. E15-1]
MQLVIRRIKELSFVVALVASPVCLFAQQADSVAVTRQYTGGTVITGSVLDAASGLPVPGISVSVPGYSAALTDDDGNFKLNIPNPSAAITITGEGFQRKQVAMKGQQSVTVRVYENTFGSLYEVANLSGGVAQPLNHTTSAVTSLNPGQEKYAMSATTPENFLQGRVAGLNVIRRSGEPGIGGNLALRGYSSLYTGNQPLIVVDGMIYDINDYGGSLISGHYTNPLSNIDIKDIDNISVVKDATSIYGSKGANGAIFITTGHAEQLATRIDFASYAGVNMTPEELPVMDAYNYRVYLSDVLRGSGYSDQDIQALPFMNDDPGAPGYHNYHNDTDWQKEAFDQSFNKNYYLKVSGGDNIAKYALSMGYLDQGGTVRNTDFNRYTTRFNADLNMSPKLQVQTNLGFSYSEQNLAEQGLAFKTNPIYLSLIKAPFLSRNEISDEGITSPNLSDLDLFHVGNPAAVVSNVTATGQNYRFFGSIDFNYELTKDLTASTQFGINYDKIRETFFIPRRGLLADTLESAVAESRMGNQVKRLFTVYSDSRLSYDKRFNNIHHLNANVGLRYSDNNSESDYGLGFNSATDELKSIGTGSTALRRASGDIGKWNWMSLYSGLNYGFLDKYFLTLSMAIDGSSRFGREGEDGLRINGNRFGVFPSVGAAWLVSSEDFMAGVTPIDLLKVRATYSITGNDDIGNYTSRQFYVSQNLLGLQGLVRGNIGNPALQWETYKKLNAGLDLALLNERLALSVDAYSSTTQDMLIQERLSTAVGFAYMYTNNGAMENKGLELSVNGRLINSETFKWDVGLKVAKYKNEITQLPGERMLTDFAGATILTQVGEQANLFYGYKTNGVYTSDEEASSAGLSTVTPDGTVSAFRGGDIRFLDLNGDNLINSDDRAVIGNPNPDFTGMFSTRFTYKKLSLDAAFTFSKGNDIYNYTRAQLESMRGTENQLMSVQNRWRANGQQTDMPRASWGDPMGNARFSDRWIEDGSYLRLRTLTLNYDLALNNRFLKNASVYATANNLFTVTDYLGYDPEFSASSSVFAQGVDLGLIPQFRSVLLGVRLGL